MSLKSLARSALQVFARSKSSRGRKRTTTSPKRSTASKVARKVSKKL